MDDDIYCLFVTTACMLTLAMPAGAQVLFASFAFILAVAARVLPDGENQRKPPNLDRHDVSG
ncbi:MAG TPA: hypothetical protein VGM60_20220 [Pseudonocardia sp.]|jgi:hypothetical protein|uniref:hypothetical protein n=1 Tax=Pseudonocardia sp. TaxID=60912 RepID=UPI002F42264A